MKIFSIFGYGPWTQPLQHCGGKGYHFHFLLIFFWFSTYFQLCSIFRYVPWTLSTAPPTPWQWWIPFTFLACFFWFSGYFLSAFLTVFIYSVNNSVQHFYHSLLVYNLLCKRAIASMANMSPVFTKLLFLPKCLFVFVCINWLYSTNRIDIVHIPPQTLIPKWKAALFVEILVKLPQHTVTSLTISGHTWDRVQFVTEAKVPP